MAFFALFKTMFDWSIIINKGLFENVALQFHDRTQNTKIKWIEI